MTGFDEGKHKRDVKGRFTFNPHAEAVGLSLEPMPSEGQRYSFVEDWQALSDSHNHDFGGVPASFFTNPVLKVRDVEELGNQMDSMLALAKDSGLDKDLGEYSPTETHPWRLRTPNEKTPGTVLNRAVLSVTNPKDGLLTDTQLEAVATDLGLTGLVELEKPEQVTVPGTRAWTARDEDGRQFVVLEKASPSRNFQSERWTYDHKMGGLDSRYQFIDTRALVGAQRVKQLTGVNPLEVGADSSWGRPEGLVPTGKHQRLSPKGREFVADQTKRLWAARELVDQLEARREEGANFRAQRAHFQRQSASTTARAWEEKANPDRQHQQMMDDTVLNESFDRVEIDNDVDAEEFVEFEADWVEAAKRLPPLPKGLEPTLRIRKLGRHHLSGMYVPQANTVVVDVRDSSTFVKEMGHYYDMVARKNASLSPKFTKIVSGYGKGLELPANVARTGARAARPAYYKTPTEVFARGFELWAHERRGVSGKGLRPETLGTFPYQPFQDANLKQELFNYFDTEFGRVPN